jgi:hypothetical protein
MPAIPVQKTARQRWFSAVSAAVLLVAVPVGALLLWQSSAGTAHAAVTSSSLGSIVNANRTNTLNFYLSLANLSPQQAIQQVMVARVSETPPPIPSANRPTRFRFR